MITKTMFVLSLLSALMAAFFAEEPPTRPSRARTRNQLLGYAQLRDTTAEVSEVEVTNRHPDRAPDDVVSRSRRSMRWRRTLVGKSVFRYYVLTYALALNNSNAIDLIRLR